MQVKFTYVFPTPSLLIFPAFSCKFQELIGDGVCHDATNTEFCQYDGGECCFEKDNTELCDECLCNESGKSLKPTNSSDIWNLIPDSQTLNFANLIMDIVV